MESTALGTTAVRVTLLRVVVVNVRDQPLRALHVVVTRPSAPTARVSTTRSACNMDARPHCDALIRWTVNWLNSFFFESNRS